MFKVYAGLDLFKGRVARLLRGDPGNPTFYPHSPPHYASRWLSEGADRLHVVDLDAALELGDNMALISELVKSLDAWVQVGGGVRNRERAVALTEAGVSRVIISSLYFQNRAEALNILRLLGRDRVAVGLDCGADGQVRMKGWREKAGISLEEAVEQALSEGFENIVVTDTSRDGTLEGVDRKMLEKMPVKVRGHVVFGGGVSSVDDILTLREMGFAGVIVGKALYEEKIDLKHVRKVLTEADRLNTGGGSL
ncbi:MAG: 1-(5-phosphoribosyl)-5-[(5-phosphoribosylamino)methylideneamino] imidazole-4-carboxamide isomerase [Candidatus Caldarchaeum sp.]|uniref:1-(5-phosphoribosyl)-5-[(5-phosphoribosylamino)methylideneamino] imidazole-4-carboxamide isomerase n=1 Tax=Caldiarchaeum subterraneum TaxID=311458 RepID=A0A7C5LAS7_CALS0